VGDRLSSQYLPNDAKMRVISKGGLLERKRTELTRTELYEKVWTTPILQLAQEFGLSDVGLAKLCRRHGIPLPGLGYWRKRETGHDPGQLPLPPSERPGLESIEIVASQKPADILHYLASQEIPEISVKWDSTLSHPFTLRTEKLFDRSKQEEKGLLIPNGAEVFHIHVSRNSLPRTLRILDAFLSACEEKQYALQWPKEAEAKLSVTVLDETIQFQITESVKAKNHVLTGEEKKNPWLAPRWDYCVTGQLRFAITNLPYSDFNIQHSWGDGKFQRLEECLGKIIVGLGTASIVTKKDREETLQRQREWAEAERREEEERQFQEEFSRKEKVLREFIKGWRENQEIGEFLGALVLEAEQQGLNDAERGNVEELLKWGKAYSRSLNPLVRLRESTQEFLRPSDDDPF
jgi:hypothetical protein